jgi:integration host factor subunit beta
MPLIKGIFYDTFQRYSMIKSELIEAITRKQSYLSHHDVERAVKCLVESMTNELAAGGRVEVRGFGSFSLVLHPARMGRNPRTGSPVALPHRHSVRFKAGLELRQRVRDSASKYRISA